jgi:hypothetical protein
MKRKLYLFFAGMLIITLILCGTASASVNQDHNAWLGGTITNTVGSDDNNGFARSQFVRNSKVAASAVFYYIVYSTHELATKTASASDDYGGYVEAVTASCTAPDYGTRTNSIHEYYYNGEYCRWSWYAYS